MCASLSKKLLLVGMNMYLLGNKLPCFELGTKYAYKRSRLNVLLLCRNFMFFFENCWDGALWKTMEPEGPDNFEAHTST